MTKIVGPYSRGVFRLRGLDLDFTKPHRLKLCY